MNKAIRILGETLDIIFNLRTTKKLVEKMKKEADEKDISINTLLNSILFDRYFRKH